MAITRLHAYITGIIILLAAPVFCDGDEQSPHAGKRTSGFTANGHLAIPGFLKDDRGHILPVDLRGTWLFMRADDPSYRLPETPDSDWEPIPVPMNWFAFPEGRLHTGLAWYRLHLRLPDRRPDGILGIQLGWIDDADETYFNGRLIGSTGSFPDPSSPVEVQHAYDRTRIYPIEASLVRPGGDNVLAVRVNSMDYNTAGIYEGRQRLGSYETLRDRFYANEIVLIVLASLYLVFGLYHAFLFLRKRSSYENLFFALFCVLLGVITLFRSELKYQVVDNYRVLKFIEYQLEFILPVIFFHFILYHFEQKRYTRLSLAFDALSAASLLAIVWFYPSVKSYYLYDSYIGYWIIVGYALYSLYYIFSFRRERQDARIMLVGSAIFTVTILIDILAQYVAFAIPWIAHYGFLAFIVSIVVGMGNRFVQLYNHVVKTESELRSYKSHLEELVHSRTKELLREIEIRKSTEQSLRDSRADLERRNLMMEKDLEHAQLVHRSFLPLNPVEMPGLKIDYRFIPLAIIGGDYFSFTTLKEGGLGVFIGDVCGHGVSAALFLSLVKALTDRTCSRFGNEPLNYIRAMNDDLIKNMPTLLFTALYGLLTRDEKSGKRSFAYARAGHTSPILYRAAENRTLVVESRGPIIGLTPDMRIEPVTLPLEKGDRIYLYTDGIPEVENRERVILGYDNLAGLFHGAHRPDLGATLDGVIGKCRDYMEGGEFTDDIVLIGMEVTE